MKNVIQGTSCANSPAQFLVAYRRSIMDMLVGCPLITTAEYDTAMQRTLACQNLATLQKWYRNTVREIARREEEVPTPAPVTYATVEQTQQIQRLANSVYILRSEKTAALLALPTCTEAQAAEVIADLTARATGRRSATPAQRAQLRRLVQQQPDLPARERQERLLDTTFPLLTRHTATHLLTAWRPVNVGAAEAQAATVRYALPGSLSYLRYFQN